MIKREKPKSEKAWGLYDDEGYIIVLANSRDEVRSAKRQEGGYINRVIVKPL